MAKARQQFRRSKLRPAGTKSDHCFLAALLTEFDVTSETDRLTLENKYGVDINRLKEAKKLHGQYMMSLGQLGFLGTPAWLDSGIDKKQREEKL